MLTAFHSMASKRSLKDIYIYICAHHCGQSVVPQIVPVVDCVADLLTTLLDKLVCMHTYRQVCDIVGREGGGGGAQP